MSATLTGGAAGNLFDPVSVNLTAAADDPDLARTIVCYMQLGQNVYNGGLGTRISALFVILIISSAATFFPVIAARVRWVKVPLYVYLFARYFGAGVIIATAFIHLLDPGYGEIGPNTCVGMTSGWREFSWPPAIALIAIMVIFLMDFGAERYVETKYGFEHGGHVDVEGLVTDGGGSGTHQHLHTADQMSDLEHRITRSQSIPQNHQKQISSDQEEGKTIEEVKIEEADERAFRTQIAAFFDLGVWRHFHSVIIGLNLGTAGDEFRTLYPVLVFHQSFEGLGIGARMSTIPFPRRLSWMPWTLCTCYGLTTPIAIAVGLGLRTTYNPASFTANVVSGVLDSISAGILIFTGLVELLARDFLFDPSRTNDNKRLTFMLFSVLLGAAIMALLGKWA